MKLKIVMCIPLIFVLRQGFSQIDSLVIYHRKPCPIFEHMVKHIDEVKTFGEPRKFVIKSSIKIDSVLIAIKKMKLCRKKIKAQSPNYLLSCYAYVNGKEALLFTISTFNRLNCDGKVFNYENQFLDLLLEIRNGCYF